MGRVKIQIGRDKHRYIYHPVDQGIWYASGGGEDIKSVWMCERGNKEDESEKKLILVEYANSVVAYDCWWWKTPRGVVFTEPKAIYGAFEDASAVFNEGPHNWCVNQRGEWQWAGAFHTKMINQTNSEPMGEQPWVEEYGGWAKVKVLVLWQPIDPGLWEWLMLDELPTDSMRVDELPTLTDGSMDTQ